MDFLKGLLTPVVMSQTRFGLIQFLLSVVAWTVVIGLSVDVYAKDKLAFTCSCDKEKESNSNNRHCYEEYAKRHNAPLSQVYFALISGCGLVGSWIIYAVCVAPRIHRFQLNRQEGIGRSCCSTYFCYLFEVIVRICFTGGLVTLYYLQQTQTFPDEFQCHLVSRNVTNICNCYDVYGREKTDLNWAILLMNVVLGVLSFVEMVYLISIAVCDNKFRSARRDPLRDLQVQQDSFERLIDRLQDLHDQQNSSNFCLEPTDFQFISFLLNELPDGNLEPEPTHATDFQDGSPVRVFSRELKHRILQGASMCSTSFTLEGFDDLPIDQVYTQSVVQHGRAKYDFQTKRRHEILQTYLAPAEMTVERFTETLVSRPVLVNGRAGIGKTVFSLTLAREWAKGTLLKKFRFVFLLNFRQLNLLKDKQLLTLKGLLSLSPYSPDLEKGIFKYIVRHPQQVLVLFDGLDEFRHYQQCLSDEKRFPNVTKMKMSVPALYAKLAMGKILPGAAVITTSRPTAVPYVAEIFSDTSTYEIMGFTPVRVQCYLNGYFIHENDVKRIVCEYIFGNANILSLCYIPVCCMIICSFLKFVCSGHCHEKLRSFGSLPKTLTELYKGVLKMFIAKHSPEYRAKPVQELSELSECSQDTVEKLSVLAFHTMKMRKIVFRRKDFTALGLEEDIQVLVNSGIVHSMPRCRTGPVTFETQYCFVHLTLQEFLAARKIALSCTADEFSEFIRSPNLFPTWELVVQFVAGLLPENVQNGSTLTNILFQRFDWGVNAVSFVDDVQDLETNSAGSLSVGAGSASGSLGCTSRCRTISGTLSSLHSLSNSPPMPSYHTETTPSENDENLHTNWNTLDTCTSSCNRSEDSQSFVSFGELQCESDLLLLKMKCVNEQQNRQLASQIAVKVGKCLDLSGIQVCDADICTAVFYTFRHAVPGILRRMNFFNNNIRALGCAKLADLLCSGHGPSQSMDLHSNEVGDEGVIYLAVAFKHPKCTLELLNLSSNGLGRVAIAHLAEAVSHPNCNLQALYICHNKIGCQSLEPLGKALKNPHCKITHLDLPHCGIGNEDCKVLAQSLEHEQCKLLNLNLQSNHLITCTGMISLVSCISRSECRLESLNLSSTGCTEEEMRIVCEVLASNLKSASSKLKALTMCSCRINDDSLCKLVEAIANPNCKLTFLDLARNLIGDEGCHHFANALCSPGCGLNALNLQQNLIGDKGALLFTGVLELPSCKLESLDLSSNEISHDAQVSLLNAWGELRGGLSLI